jgi:hypothetical protein
MTSKSTNPRFSGLLTDTAHAQGGRLEADISGVILGIQFSDIPSTREFTEHKRVPVLITVQAPKAIWIQKLASRKRLYVKLNREQHRYGETLAE